MPAQNVKAIVKRYFTEFPEDNSKWKCRCGKILTQKPNTGWSSLFQHIKSQHSDYLQDAQSTLQSSVVSKPASTKKAANIYSWLEWIGCGLKPFNFVENELTRKYCNLAPIAENTLKKYMEIVTKEVEVVIETKLPNRFVSVGRRVRLISLVYLLPILVKTIWDMSQRYDNLEWELGLYNKTFENVVCNCWDNAEVNMAIANLCNLPHLGCNSHRLNLAVKEFTKTSSNLLEKVNNLMIKLRGLKLSGKLRKLTDLRPVYRNDTRWLSVYEMLDRYCKLRPFLVDSSFAREQVVMDYLPTAREHADLLALLEPTMKLESVTLALQRDNITIADVNCLFQKVTSEFPRTKKYLDPMAPIVHSPVLKSAVCKL